MWLLTSKQDKFVDCLLEGMTQKDAYLEAYPASRKWKDSTVKSRASELINTHEGVKAEYQRRKEELRKAHAEKLLYTREQAIMDLKWLQETSKEDIKKKGYRHANSSSYLQATKELIDLENLDDLKKVKLEEIKSQHDDSRNQAGIDNFLGAVGTSLDVEEVFEDE